MSGALAALIALLLMGCHEPTAVEYEELEAVCVVRAAEVDTVNVEPVSEILTDWVEVCTA